MKSLISILIFCQITQVTVIEYRNDRSNFTFLTLGSERSSDLSRCNTTKIVKDYVVEAIVCVNLRPLKLVISALTIKNSSFLGYLEHQKS